MGDSAIGIITAFHYDSNHKSPLNAEFVSSYNEAVQSESRYLFGRRL